jgi:hypothetical protein
VKKALLEVDIKSGDWISLALDDTVIFGLMPNSFFFSSVRTTEIRMTFSSKFSVRHLIVSSNT